MWNTIPTRCKPNAEQSTDEVAVWQNWYKCRFNIRYHEIEGNAELAERWKALAAKYQAIHDDMTTYSEQRLDELWLEMHAIEVDEPQPPNVGIARRAQGDLNEEIYGERDWRKIVEGRK